MESPAVLWDPPQCPFPIAFAPEKLDEIRVAVVDGFYALPRGGVEVGGVLFGSYTNQGLRIQDYRTIPCEHLTGPSFTLSAQDEAGFADGLSSGPGKPVGWFHSHTRTELCLSPQDAKLHNRYFPEPWQVALVLRPQNLQPLRAGYFFREPGASMKSGATCREFIIAPLPRVREAPLPHGHGSETTGGTVGTRNPGASVGNQEELTPSRARQQAVESIPAPLFQSLGRARPKRHSGPFWAAAALALITLATAAFTGWKSWTPSSPEPLRLHASEDEGKLLIRWTPVRDASAGSLHITDGGKDHDIPLDALQLSRGFYVFPRQFEKDTVRLKAGPREEYTAFAGPITAPAPAEKLPGKTQN